MYHAAISLFREGIALPPTYLTSDCIRPGSISRVLGRISQGALAAAVLTASTAPALALTQEAAIANCRSTIGRPFVQSCVRGMGGRNSANFEANLASCRAQITPKVRACVMAAMNAANGRANVAVAVPTEAAPAAPANALPVGFVAPPRTIADITAILDSEKPDVKKLEELKADADDQPTGKESRGDLAQFYFDRGNARATPCRW